MDLKVAEEIKKDYDRGVSTKNLGEKYGVGRGTILRILNKSSTTFRTWGDFAKHSSQASLKQILEDGGRICTECGIIKNLDQFRMIKSKLTGEKDRPRSHCKECQEKKRVKKKYGLSAEDVILMLEAQEYRCGICGCDITSESKNIDHNHITGETRGLLCQSCNRRLGSFEKFEDEIKDYLLMHQERPSRTKWLMDMAKEVAKRSTCNRHKVGALLVYKGRILSHGYNGAPSGVDHCNHPLTEEANKGCEVSVHAESNAIVWAARWGINIDGSTLYTTLSPCLYCSQLIANSGVVEVIIDQPYRDLSGLELLKESGVEVNFLESKLLSEKDPDLD